MQCLFNMNKKKIEKQFIGISSLCTVNVEDSLNGVSFFFIEHKNAPFQD